MKRFTSQYQIVSRSLLFWNNKKCLNCDEEMNSIRHAHFECPGLWYIRRFLDINVCLRGIKLKEYLFNAFKINGSNMNKTLFHTFLGWKAYIPKCLTEKVKVESSSLHSIVLAACTRYSTYNLKCPSLTDERRIDGEKVSNLIRYKNELPLFDRSTQMVKIRKLLALQRRDLSRR